MRVSFLSLFFMFLLLTITGKASSMKNEKHILDLTPFNLATCAKFLSLHDFNFFYEVLRGDDRTKTMRQALETRFFKKCQKRILSNTISDYVTLQDEKGDHRIQSNIIQVLKVHDFPASHTLILYESGAFEIFGKFITYYHIFNKDLILPKNEDSTLRKKPKFIPANIFGILAHKDGENILISLIDEDFIGYHLDFSHYHRPIIGIISQWALETKIIALRNSQGYIFYYKEEKGAHVVISRLVFDADYKLLRMEQKGITDENIEDIFDAKVYVYECLNTMEILKQYIKYYERK